MTTLEDELRTKLREPGPVPPPGMAEHILRRVHRQRVTRGSALVGAFAVGCAAAAFALTPLGGERDVVTSSSGSGCDAVTADAVGTGVVSGRTREFIVVLTNSEAGSVCRVHPDVPLSLVAEGRRLDVRLLPPVRDDGSVDLARGDALSIELVWSNWCQERVAPAQVTIELPGAASVETRPFQLPPPCSDSSRESTLRIFQMRRGEVADADIPGPLRPRPEADEKVQVGAKYYFSVYTHCGVRDIDLEGERWDTAQPVSERETVAAGWDPMGQPGWLTIVSKNRAVFRDSAGHVVTFERQPGSEPSGCL